MCDYCEHGKLLVKYDDGSNMFIDKYSGHYDITYESEIGWTANTQTINYCPMCGRKLKED